MKLLLTSAGIKNPTLPAYAMDDETAIKVIDSRKHANCEEHWGSLKDTSLSACECQREEKN